MPGRDGSGPLGQGPRTGGGFGLCSPQGSRPYYGEGGRRFWGRGFGYFCRRNWGRFFGSTPITPKSKALLEEERSYLAQQLEAVSKELKELESEKSKE